MLITYYSTNIWTISSNIQGQCGGATSFSINIIYPTEGKSSILLYDTKLYVSFGSNNQSIDFDGTNPACDSYAVIDNNSMK
jgi:hypothetical protein